MDIFERPQTDRPALGTMPELKDNLEQNLNAISTIWYVMEGVDHPLEPRQNLKVVCGAAHLLHLKLRTKRFAVLLQWMMVCPSPML